MKGSLMFIMVSLLFMSMVSLFGNDGPEGGPGRGGHGKRGFGPEMKGMMNEMMLEEAGVPEAKRAEIRKKEHDILKEMMDINYNIGELQIKMKTEFDKDKPDINTLKNLNSQIAELRKKQFTLIGNFKIDVMASLTVEQRKKMQESMKAKRKKFMEKMGEGGPEMDD